MAANTSLFSRARPAGKPVENKTGGFLALPGELRNDVYKHYFPDDFRCEIVSKGTDFDPAGYKRMKLGMIPVSVNWAGSVFTVPGEQLVPRVQWQPFRPRESTTIRLSRRLGQTKDTRVDALRTNWSVSLPIALMFVCRDVYRESIVLLYERTTFVFNTPNRINNFLNAFPSINLGLVTRLELHYTSYGSQPTTEGKDFRQAHLAAWTKACRAVVKQLPGLRELHIWMHVTASPLYFDLRQEWLAPLLPFRRACLMKQIPHVEAHSQRPVAVPKGLIKANVYFDTFYSRPGCFRNFELSAASIELHRLFGNAIALALQGASEEDAMAEFQAAWEGKYVRWWHHLRFSTTGW
jgi:hypothetical protein